MSPAKKETKEINPMEEDLYRQFIYYRTYSRFNDEIGRRETWTETVDRYMGFMRKTLAKRYTVQSLKDVYDLKEEEFEEIRQAILKQEVMPSMRLMWAAGPTAERCNVAGYNCSYVAVEQFRDMAETLYLLCSGTGVGFSVEQSSIDKLPTIKKQDRASGASVFVVADSKEGWADAVLHGLNTWGDGKDVVFDFSEIRPMGARLKTMGGRASGPQPLIELLELIKEKVLNRQGQKLRTIDVHDIMTKIGDIVVSGGVRRSAMISLSDLEDKDMTHAKDGKFWEENPHRALANNSAVYNEQPTKERFAEEWQNLRNSHSGERGIFNRGDLRKQVPERRWEKWVGLAAATPNGKKVMTNIGTNPCGEIILLPKQFCNLTEIVAREDDTDASLDRKARIAAILGTYQSTLTDFKYLSERWKKNCEAEHLLGVSITGQWDSERVREPNVLKRMRDIAVETNKEYAIRFNTTQSTSVTCGKPSGTVSQLVDASSGLHTRFSPYYIRRVRITGTDPLFKMLRDQGVPFRPEVGQTEENAHTFVLEFPVKSPEGAKTNADHSAIDQLKHWLVVKKNWTEHNPSATIYIKENEWDEVRDWVYTHWEQVGGLSFLPFVDHVYELAPYEAVSKEKYEELKASMPKIDFSELSVYEQEDNTEGAKALACVSGACDVSDLIANLSTPAGHPVSTGTRP